MLPKDFKNLTTLTYFSVTFSNSLKTQIFKDYEKNFKISFTYNLYKNKLLKATHSNATKFILKSYFILSNSKKSLDEQKFLIYSYYNKLILATVYFCQVKLNTKQTVKTSFEHRNISQNVASKNTTIKTPCMQQNPKN